MKGLSHLVIIGRTRQDRENMTSVMIKGCKELDILYSRVDDAPFPDHLPSGTYAILVSTERRFTTVLAECERRNIPLIVATSKVFIPEDLQTVVVNAPNLGLMVNALFDIMPRLGALFRALGAKCDVAEFHQATKAPGSITALKFADALGVPREAVGSGRSDALAKVFLNVPEDHVGGFARIGIIAKACGMKVNITAETDGRSAYFFGLTVILKKLIELDPVPGRFEADEIVFGNMR